MSGSQGPTQSGGNEESPVERQPEAGEALLLCCGLTEPLTALDQYLQAACRHAVTLAQPDAMFAEMLGKASAQAAAAGELVRRLRRHLDGGGREDHVGSGGERNRQPMRAAGQAEADRPGRGLPSLARNEEVE